MREFNWKRLPFRMLAVTALLSLVALAGCAGIDGRSGEEMMMPAPTGYKVTITNRLAEELLAPVVVTHARNDALLFDGHNYVTAAAEDQILHGAPVMVLESIAEAGGYAVAGHGMEPIPDDPDARVLLGSGQAVEIAFDEDATALRIVAMVAPTVVPDNYVSAVADVPMAGSVTVPLSRFDIGYDEMTREIRLVAENVGTVTIERIGGEMADDGDMTETATYTVEVMNGLSEEFFAPIVATRANDEHYLFDGVDVTPEAEHQILFGPPTMVVGAIGEGGAVVFHGDAGPPGVLLPAGTSAYGTFDTDATALRIIAMVAPTIVPDNYVSAVVNVATLGAGESVTAPLTRFDIGHDETVSDHGAEMPGHGEMPQTVHRHGDRMSDITLVDGVTVGTVTVSRQ